MFIIYIVDCIAEQHGLVVKRSSGNQEVGGSYPAALIGGKNKNWNTCSGWKKTFLYILDVSDVGAYAGLIIK